MLKLLERNLIKKFISWKTFCLIIIAIGVMVTCYQHLVPDNSLSPAYLILEGPFSVFRQVVSSNNSILISTTLLVIMMICFIDSPVINQDDNLFIIRTGKRKWMISEIIGIFLASIIWILLINIMGCVTSFNHMDWNDFKIYDSNIRCMLVYFLAYSSIGLLILLFHVANIKAIGIAIMSGLFVLEKFLLDILPNNVGTFFSDEKTNEIREFVIKFAFMQRMENGYKVNHFVPSIIYFSSILFVLIVLNIIYARRHDVG